MPRLWPLLDPGQDPTSPAARVAYHLYRLNLVGTPLRTCGYFPARKATQIAQGRVVLTDADIHQLAQALRVDTDDLLRPLTPDEDLAWRFYRESARARRSVWIAARNAWQEAGMTMTAAAQVIGLPVTRVSEALNGGKHILDYEGALRLSRMAGLRDPFDLLNESVQVTEPREAPSAVLE